MCEPKQWRERSLPHPLHDHTSLTHIWTGVCPSHLHSQPCLPHPYLHGQEGHTSVPPTSTHSHASLTHTWRGGTCLCPSHLHSQPHLPHPYLDRRDTPLSLPLPLTATPLSPIPGQEGHTSVPPTSTHSHTSLTHTWTGGTHLCPSHLHSQQHLPHPYLPGHTEKENPQPKQLQRISQTTLMLKVSL